MFKEIKGKKLKDQDPEIIAWRREEKGALSTPLMHSFPQPGDTIKNKKFFAVKDYEKTLFYNKGELIGVLGGGVYELDKKARIKGTEIVWIDTSLNEIPWGIPQTEGIPTKDGYVVGLYGDLKLKINDVKTFYNDVVGGTKMWIVQDLKKWIIGLLHTSLRDIFKNYNAKNIILEDRERVVNLITSKITEEFLRYGLELETFNVIGIKAPDDTQELFKTDKYRADYLARQRKDIQGRIEELKNKLKEQQNLLLKDNITQEDYDKKKKQIQVFIDEAQEELRRIDEKN
ncbi:MAG: SPFH domain-containing protein [Promethearchaeota archaeon]